MNIVTRAMSVSLMLFSVIWAGTALAYDKTLYSRVGQLQKAANTLSTNLTYRTHRYFNKNVVNDARNLARTAKNLKFAIRNKAANARIHNLFSKLNYRFNYLMSNLGYQNYNYNSYNSYDGYRARNIGFDVGNVQRTFHMVHLAFGGYRYDGYRYGGYRGYPYGGYPYGGYRYNGYPNNGYYNNYRYYRDPNYNYKYRKPSQYVK